MLRNKFQKLAERLKKRPSDASSMLIKAAEIGDVETTRKLFLAGAELMVRQDVGHGALFSAAVGGHANLVEELIQLGADVHESVGDGATILHFTAMLGQTGAAVVLIRHGASAYAQDAAGKTPVDYARSFNFNDTAMAMETAASLKSAARIKKVVRQTRQPRL